MVSVFLSSVLCLVLVGVSQINADCYPDEVEYHGRCYYFGRVSEVVNHDTAHSRCMNNHHGGELASVNSADENTFLKNQAKSHTWGGSAYLIGGTDQKTEGVWEWADGTEFTFTDWGPGQPDNFINAEDCLTYYRPLGLASDYFWADVSCDVPAELYICERAASKGAAIVG